MSVTYRLSRRRLSRSAQLDARAASLLVLMKSIMKGYEGGSEAGHAADRSRQLQPIVRLIMFGMAGVPPNAAANNKALSA